CWRRLAQWHQAGVWQRLHELLLAELNAADKLDWSKAVIDGSHVRALKGGPKPARARSTVPRPARNTMSSPKARASHWPSPLTGGNRHDVTQLLPLIQAIPSVRGKRGRPRRRPDSLYADRAYDYDIYRDQVSGKGITPHFARRGVEHGSGLGVHRWVVEQTVALLHWFRRLRMRWESGDDIHEAFMSLACSIICYRRLVK